MPVFYKTDTHISRAEPTPGHIDLIHSSPLLIHSPSLSLSPSLPQPNWCAAVGGDVAAWRRSPPLRQIWQEERWRQRREGRWSDGPAVRPSPSARSGGRGDGGDGLAAEGDTAAAGGETAVVQRPGGGDGGAAAAAPSSSPFDDGGGN